MCLEQPSMAEKAHEQGKLAYRCGVQQNWSEDAPPHLFGPWLHRGADGGPAAQPAVLDRGLYGGRYLVVSWGSGGGWAEEFDWREVWEADAELFTFRSW